MRIVSYLPPALLPRLVDAVNDVGGDHIQALSWEEVKDALSNHPRCVLVLDPYADRTNRAIDIAALLEQFPCSPVIVYTEFSPAAFQALTFLAPYGVYETLLFQADDNRARFSRLLLRAATHSLVVKMLGVLHARLQLLPAPLTAALEDLFRRPHAYASGRDLILSSRVPSTSLQRALAESGFTPPKHLFIAARLLHVISYLRDPRCTVEQAAEQTGYQQPRILTQHTLAVFGVRPSQLRTIPDEEVLSVLVAWTECKSTDRTEFLFPQSDEDSHPDY